MLIRLKNLYVYSAICDDDKVGSLEVYTLCAIMISLEICEMTYCV